MAQAQRTIVVDRPAADVFAFFADPANDTKWRPQVKEIQAQEPPSVGSRVHQVLTDGKGRVVPADFEVTGYAPNTLYAFLVVDGRVKPDGEFRFRPTADGRTEVTFMLRADLSGLRKLLLARPVQRSMDGEMANLDRAKRVLENGPS